MKAPVWHLISRADRKWRVFVVSSLSVGQSMHPSLLGLGAVGTKDYDILGMGHVGPE